MTDLVLLGASEPTAVGSHLRNAAADLGISTKFIDFKPVYASGLIYRKFAYRFFGDYPLLGLPFNRQLRADLKRLRPSYLVATGKAPIFSKTLEYAQSIGCTTINYSTDDPWNPAQSARWFFSALKHYDVIATPRTANLKECLTLSRGSGYVPFGYTPDGHYWQDLPEKTREAEVFFAGCADHDRAPYFEALVEAGIKPALYGAYWNRWSKLKPYHGGFIGLEGMRRCHAEIPISVCLVRRVNRDEHCMRTFEAPAMGACLAMEDTPEHRNIFGEDGECVVYFSDPASLVAACKKLLEDPGLRRKLRERAHQVITEGKHTYKDRLESLLELGKASSAQPQ